jgi:hypothetical protein
MGSKKDAFVRIIGLRDDADAGDRDYFQRLTPAEKMAMVTTMFHDQWRLKGGDEDQLRLRRDITRVQRRRR